MKDYHIYLFNNIANLNKTVGFINIKEQFVNNSFVEEAYVLLVLSEDFSQRKEIPFKKIQNHLVKGQSFNVPDYANKYSKQVHLINKYVDENNILLSWLDIFQIALIISEEENINESTIKNAIIKLDKFKEIIQKDY